MHSGRHPEMMTDRVRRMKESLKISQNRSEQQL